MIGHIDQLRYCDGIDGLDVAMELGNIVEFCFEIMGGKYKTGIWVIRESDLYSFLVLVSICVLAGFVLKKKVKGVEIVK